MGESKKTKNCFIYLPHMYMIWNWKVFTIKQNWLTNLSDNILNVLGSKSFLLRIWPRTFCFSGRSILLIFIFCLGFDLILSRFNTSASQSHRSQSKRLNSTISRERKKFVVRKIEFDPKILRIYSDKFVNQLCLIANSFQFEIMYINAVSKWSSVFVFLLLPINGKNDRAQS